MKAALLRFARRHWKVLATALILIVGIPFVVAPIIQRLSYRDYLAKAEAGDSMYQYNLAKLYADGVGVEADSAKAAHWYLMSAKQGFIMAQFRVAGIYAAGVGVPQDLEQAFRWYLITAEQGLVEGMFEVANAYGTPGMGVEVDYVEAYKWWHLARNWFERDDTVRVTSVTDLNLTEISLPSMLEGRLTPEQIEEAKRRADAWEAKEWTDDN